MIRVPLTLVLLLVLCTGLLPAQGQFVPTDGPFAGHPTHLVTAPNGTLFLFSEYHDRLLRSVDGGETWTMIRTGLPSGSAAALHAAADGTVYLAMALPQSLFRSTDNGTSWEKLDGPPGVYQALPILASDPSGRIYLLMGRDEMDQKDGRAFRSADRGTTWTPFAHSLGELRSVTVASGGTLLVVRGNYYGGKTIHRSADDGVTWTQVAQVAYPDVELFQDVLAGPGGTVWAISQTQYHAHPYHSSDNGLTWLRAADLPSSYVPGAFVMPDGRLLVGAELNSREIFRYARNESGWKIDTLRSRLSGTEYYHTPITMTSDGAIMTSFGGILLRSDDDGASWGITGLSPGWFHALAIGRDERVYLSRMDGGVVRSSDQGKTWTLVNDGIAEPYDVLDLLADDRGRVFALARGDSIIYRSMNDGDSWSRIGPEEMSRLSSLFIAANGDLYLSARAGSPDGAQKLYRSADAGDSWTALPFHPNVGGNLARLTESSDGTLYMLGYTALYRSADRGGSWTFVRSVSSIPIVPGLVICSNGDLLLSDADGLHRSTDRGGSWSPQSPPADNPTLFEEAMLLGTAPSGTVWLAAKGAQFHVSYDHGRSWSNILPEGAYQDIAVTVSGDIYAASKSRTLYRGRDIGPWSKTAQSSGKEILALDALANGTVFVSDFNKGIALTRNNGYQWFGRGIQGVPTYAHSLMAESEDTIWAGTNIGIFRTFDGAITWKHVSNAIPQTAFIHALLRDPSGTIYAGTFGEGVYQSTGNGSGWVPRNSGLGNLFVKGLSLGTDGRLFAATNGGVYRTDDRGESWKAANGDFPITFYANAVLYREGRYLLAANKRVYRSMDLGERWEQVDVAIGASAEIHTFYADESGTIWLGCDAGIFFSRDDGRTWEPSGLGDKSVRAFTENRSYLFAGTSNDGVYRMVKGVASAGNGSGWEKISSASLQAMPNPSGGSVQVRFTLPEPGHAALDLYDMRGTRVATLLDAEMTAGEHVVGWESDLPPGAYYCILTSRGVRCALELLLIGGDGR